MAEKICFLPAPYTMPSRGLAGNAKTTIPQSFCLILRDRKGKTSSMLCSLLAVMQILRNARRKSQVDTSLSFILLIITLTVEVISIFSKSIATTNLFT